MARRQVSKSKITADLTSSILTGYRHRAPDEAPTPAADQEPEATVAEPQPVDPTPAPTVTEMAPEPQALAEPVAAEPQPQAEPEPEFGSEFAEEEDAHRTLPPRQACTRDLTGRSTYGRVDGRSLRRTDRTPLATRISAEHHDTVRRLASETRLSIAELIEQGIDLVAKKYDRRKK